MAVVVVAPLQREKASLKPCWSEHGNLRKRRRLGLVGSFGRKIWRDQHPSCEGSILKAVVDYYLSHYLHLRSYQFRELWATSFCILEHSLEYRVAVVRIPMFLGRFCCFLPVAFWELECIADLF